MFLYGLTANNDCLCMQHSLIGLRNRQFVYCEVRAWFFIQYVHCHVSGVVFLGSAANAELVPKIHVNLHVSPHAAVSKINCKYFALPTQSEFCHNGALQTPNSAQILSSFPLQHTPSRSLPHHLTFLTSKAVPCHQSDLTTRTSGQCLATLEQRNFLTPLHPFEH